MLKNRVIPGCLKVKVSWHARCAFSFLEEPLVAESSKGVDYETLIDGDNDWPGADIQYGAGKAFFPARSKLWHILFVPFATWGVD